MRGFYILATLTVLSAVGCRAGSDRPSLGVGETEKDSKKDSFDSSTKVSWATTADEGDVGDIDGLKDRLNDDKDTPKKDPTTPKTSTNPAPKANKACSFGGLLSSLGGFGGFNLNDFLSGGSGLGGNLDFGSFGGFGGFDQILGNGGADFTQLFKNGNIGSSNLGGLETDPDTKEQFQQNGLFSSGFLSSIFSRGRFSSQFFGSSQTKLTDGPKKNRMYVISVTEPDLPDGVPGYSEGTYGSIDYKVYAPEELEPGVEYVLTVVSKGKSKKRNLAFANNSQTVLVEVGKVNLKVAHELSDFEDLLNDLKGEYPISSVVFWEH